MSKEQESLKTEIYGLLKSRGLNPVSKDSSGDTVPIPTEAEVFEFMFSKDEKDYGKVWVTLDGLRQLIVYFGKDVADSPKNGSQDSNSWSQLHRALSRFATSRQLSFELSDQSNLEADMAKREHTKREEQVNEGYYPIGKNASGNNNVPSVTMRIQHTRPIEEGEQRFRNIARIFVENQDGERILLPTTKPGLARTYVRHIAEGGKPNDERWNHLNNLCEEYQKMAGFVRATRNGQFNESAQSLVNEGINHYQKLRETLGKLQGKRGYNEYFESYTPALMEDEEQVDLSEMFMSSSLDPRIESVMPILSKLSRNITETKKDMAETIALEEWADSLTELSNEKLGDYKKAAGADASAADKAGDFKRGDKRFKGIVQATIKQGDNDTKKHQEPSKEVKEGDQRKLDIVKRMHGILSKNKEQGVAEDQLDEIGDTPAGKAALRAVQNKAYDTMDAWSKNSASGFSSTPKQVSKATGAAVAAGRRLHGFGPDRMRQDTVMARDALRKQLAVAEGQLDEIGDTPAGRATLQKYQDKAGNQIDAHSQQVHNKSHLPTDTKMAKRNAGTVAAGNRIHGFGIAKNQQDKVTGRFKYRDAVGTTHEYQKNNPLEQGVGEGIVPKPYMPPGLASATTPPSDDTSRGWQGHEWDPEQDDNVEHLTFQTREQTTEKPGMKPTTTYDTQNTSSKTGITSTHDVDEGISRLKELAGVQTHPVQAQNNIQGTDLDDVGARAYPVPNRGDIQGTDLDDVGARAYPVRGPGKIEVNNLDPIPLSPLDQINVNPHPPVTHVDLTQNSSNDIPAGNKLVRPIKPLEHEIEEGAYDPEYRGGHNNEFDELEDLLSKSGMSQDDLMRQRFLTSKYGLNTPADMVKLPALKKDAEAGYKTRKAEIDTDLEKRNQQYLQDKLMDLEYQQDPGAFVKRRTQQLTPTAPTAPTAPTDIAAEPGMDYSLGRAKLGSSPSTKLPNFRPDLSVEVPSSSPDSAPTQTNQLDTRNQNSSIFQQLAQLRNRTRGSMTEASHADQGVNTMLERMKKLSGM